MGKGKKKAVFWIDRFEVMSIGLYAIATGPIWADVALAFAGKANHLALPGDVATLIGWSIAVVVMWAIIVHIKTEHLE